MLHPQLPARRHADVRRGATHVERDHAVVARRLAHRDAADDPGHRPGHQELRGPLGRALDGQRAAVGGHQVEVGARRQLVQRVVHAAQVAARLRADVGVQRRGGEALVLAVLRRDLVRDRQVGLGELLRHDLPHPPLVLRVEEREQEADAHRVDLLLAQLAHGLAHLVLVERRVHLARRHHPLGDRQAQAALDQRGLAPGQVLVDRERLRAPVAADVDQVAEAARGDHSRARAVALEHDVGRDRGAVEELVEGVELDPRQIAQLAQPGHRRLGGIRGRGGHLVDRHLPARVVDQHQVGEGAAHVDPNPDHGARAVAVPGCHPRQPTTGAWSAS